MLRRVLRTEAPGDMRTEAASHCCLYLALIILGGLALCGHALAQEEVNLALNKPYSCNCEVLPGWTGLTDGAVDSDSAPGCFATDNSSKFPKEVTVDLGMLYPVTRIAVHNSANGNTRQIALSASADGRQYTTLREFVFPDGEYMALVHSFPQRLMRYVRVTMADTWRGGPGGDNCLYLREVQVFGNPKAGVPSQPNSTAMAQARNPAFVPYWLRVFQRYCLEGKDEIRVAVLGDSFAVPQPVAGQDWLTLFAASLGRHYGEKRIKLENLAEDSQSPAAVTSKAKEWSGGAAPDIVLLAYGRDAALAAVPPEKLRSELVALTDALMDRTNATLVFITPPPLLQAEKMSGYERTKGKSSNAYAYEVESLATARNFPLVRSASALVKDTQEITKLYRDTYHLNDAGQQAIAAALFGVFR